MFIDFTEKFYNILPPIDILLVFPMSTASYERGFSCLNRIKTQYRSRLEMSTLDFLLYFLLCTGVEVSSTEFDLHRTIALCWSSGERA